MNDLKNIYAQLVATIQSTLSALKKQITWDTVLGYVHFQAPTDFSLWTNFPIISTVRLSVWNLLRNRELPSPLDLYYAYR